MALPLSALIITHNEEKNIARCLESLTWVEEILVIDGGSSDRTLAICRDPGAAWATKIRVIENPWPGFRVQRNLCLKEAKHDWVLVVDADERCTPALAHRLRELLSATGGPAKPAYKVQRLEYFLGKHIRHGIWSPSYQDRFYNRQGIQYINDIHEYPNYPPNPGVIQEALEHSPDFAPERFLEKMNKYTSIEARDRVARGMRTNPFRLFFAFPAMFLKTYFYYEGYKDGIHGFVISLLEGVSRVVRHIKIWQYSRRNPS
ncbi:MAG: glycosyltransferase family 2 protein [Bacteriovoracia bacterium]